ncbi:MAG TPA: hypothetical protein VJH23_03035 [archaeon]|nr:hypothetical protein [archaeon]
MSKFTPEQKKIAFALVQGSKSVDALNKSLGMPFDVLNENLKQMHKLNLVKVEGYPSKYMLVESVLEGVRRRKEIAEKDPFELRLKATIEITAVEESFLKKHMKEIEGKLKEQKVLTIYDVYQAPTLRQGTHFRSYLEVNLSAKDFTAIVQFMYFFGPTSVEVIKPAKITLAMDDLQDALMEMAQMIQAYNHTMLKSMAKEELEEFAKNLYMPVDRDKSK